MILFWWSVAASAVAVVGCAYLIAAAVLVRRFARDRASPAPGGGPAVTILKPLHGNEPGLFDNLRSFFMQDYRGDTQIVFGVQDPGDGAIAAVERLRKAQPDRDLDLVIDTRAHGVNRKVSNLVNMAPRIRHEVIVLADSDMRVEPDYLSCVIAALERPGVGAVTCLYYGAAAGGTWARQGALLINAHFLPSVVVGLALGRARPCFGSTIARRRGYAVAIPPFAIAHICTETSLRDLWRHQLRWARTVRSIDPSGYAGSLVSHALPWALIAALLGAGSAAALPAVLIAMAAIACRMALLRQVEHAYALPPQTYGLLPACDLLSFAVFVISFLNWEVSWKGRRLRMVAGAWTAGRGAQS